MRIGSIFIILCMALVAGSIGAALHYLAAVPITECAYISLAILFALMTLEVIASRNRDKTEMTGRIEELSRAASDISREVGTLSRRVSALENATNAEMKSLTAPLSQEIGELADLVENLAESVAVHDALLAAPRPVAEAPAVAPAVPEDNAKEKAEKKPRRTREPLPSPFAGMDAEAILNLIRGAVETDRLELYLQPIVTLPQRKARFYEAFSRLRLADGRIIEAKDFLAPARAAGLLPVIDHRVIQRCVQVVRRLAAKNREAGLFINISAETLRDGKIFPEILALLEAHRAIAASLVFEMTQAEYRLLGPSEQINLTLLAERGFPVSLDRMEDLKVDPRVLSERGVRFIKVAGDLLLHRGHESGSEVHPADLAEFLARFGIDLVADRIENESLVVDLLDYDVRFGQGFLFSAPRPMRPDIMQSGGESAVEEPAPAKASGASAIAQIARRIG
ncbi:MAG TPA: EAL domain-containing protein [Xanthobacteraceae bacterium]|jgi:cyclic-di-GMP phosphodiesterase TipF (flagellum assembly factor)|nr:EAL domain-containing protein [Xanthobacteraceae bacterium]